jgi:hypothetical protein
VNGHRVSGGSQCTPANGYLSLVSERGELQLRNAQIWELPTGTHAADAGRSGQAAQSHRPLYNRVQLDHWKVLSGQWKPEDWRLSCSSSTGEIEVELGADVEHLFFDFQRPTRSEGGRILPFRIGDAKFSAADEAVGRWNRVHVDFTDAQVKVTLNGSRQVTDRDSTAVPRLTLTADGAATQFCNVFVRAK